MIIPASNRGDSASDRMSIMTTDTAVTARSMRESIMSLYGHQSYYQIILDPREGNFDMAPEMLVDQSRISMIIEDHLHPNTSQSSNLSGHGKREAFTEEPVLGGGDTAEFFDNEVMEAEGTETLWDTVFKHKENKRSTPSAKSVASTVLTRASNVIQIAFIPGVTKRSVDETPPSTPAALMDKPLPPLPYHRARALSSYTASPDDLLELERPRPRPSGRPQEDGLAKPRHQFGILKKTSPGSLVGKQERPSKATQILGIRPGAFGPEVEFLNFVQHEELQVYVDQGDWWEETGMVPSDYINLIPL